ncbi:MAG: pirin family protein [Pseudomonadota bacterium]
MGWNPSLEPEGPQKSSFDSVETVIMPRSRDLGGFSVARVLPSAKRRMIGPFVFLDHFGPTRFDPGEGGIDVRPHPHIGLATVTYLLEGEFQHRDSLGTNQMIYPGEVNWMIAGHGIAHSERTSDATRAKGHALLGLQTWVALPKTHEDMAPAFEHVERTALPHLEADGLDARLILGTAYGEHAPVKTFQEMFYLSAMLRAGASMALPDTHEERGLYLLSGSVLIGDMAFEACQLLVFKPGENITLTAGADGAEFVLLGGEPMDGPRYLWWNFVASTKDRIEAAKADWLDPERRAKRFPLPPDDASDFIPLPDH